MMAHRAAAARDWPLLAPHRHSEYATLQPQHSGEQSYSRAIRQTAHQVCGEFPSMRPPVLLITKSSRYIRNLNAILSPIYVIIAEQSRSQDHQSKSSQSTGSQIFIGCKKQLPGPPHQLHSEDMRWQFERAGGVAVIQHL